MKELKPDPSFFPPYEEDGYDDGNIPEIDLPKKTKVTDIIPDEVPRKDGPSGE